MLPLWLVASFSAVVCFIGALLLDWAFWIECLLAGLFGLLAGAVLT